MKALSWIGPPDGAAAIDRHLFDADPEAGRGAGGLGGATTRAWGRPCCTMTAVPQRILPVKVGWMAWMERPDGATAINERPLNAYPEGGQGARGLGGAVTQAWEDALLHGANGATKNKKGGLVP